jgi:hypothetical protein
MRISPNTLGDYPTNPHQNSSTKQALKGAEQSWLGLSFQDRAGYPCQTFHSDLSAKLDGLVYCAVSSQRIILQSRITAHLYTSTTSQYRAAIQSRPFIPVHVGSTYASTRGHMKTVRFRPAPPWNWIHYTQTEKNLAGGTVLHCRLLLAAAAACWIGRAMQPPCVRPPRQLFKYWQLRFNKIKNASSFMLLDKVEPSDSNINFYYCAILVAC